MGGRRREIAEARPHRARPQRAVRVHGEREYPPRQIFGDQQGLPVLGQRQAVGIMNGVGYFGDSSVGGQVEDGAADGCLDVVDARGREINPAAGIGGEIVGADERLAGAVLVDGVHGLALLVEFDQCRCV